MNTKEIKRNGSDKKYIALIGIGGIAFSLIAKIIFKNYYVYGILPVWIFFLCIGFLLLISGILTAIKYNKSYKRYNNKYIDLVDKELSNDYKNLYGVYLTKSYLISTINEFNIVEFKDISKILIHLIANKNCVSILTNDNKVILILESSMEACKELVECVISTNNSIKMCYDNFNNEVKK